MKKIIMTLFLSAIIFTFSNTTYADVPGTFKIGSEPKGFRGIKWGSSLNSLKEMQDCTRIEKANLTECSRIGDKNSIGKAKLEYIKYHFWNNKFYFVYIKFMEEEDYHYLVSVMRDTYGEPAKTEDKMVKAMASGWLGENTEITIYYYTEKRYGMLMINSTSLNEKAVSDRKRRNKQAAGDF